MFLMCLPKPACWLTGAENSMQWAFNSQRLPAVSINVTIRPVTVMQNGSLGDDCTGESNKFQFTAQSAIAAKYSGNSDFFVC